MVLLVAFRTPVAVNVLNNNVAFDVAGTVLRPPNTTDVCASGTAITPSGVKPGVAMLYVPAAVNTAVVTTP